MYVFFLGVSVLQFSRECGIKSNPSSLSVLYQSLLNGLLFLHSNLS